MGKFLQILKKIMDFVSNRLWKVRLSKVDKRQGILIRLLRVFALSIKKFKEDNCLTTATALTFYTLFSFVPVLALVFAIAQGFGYERTLQDSILKEYPEYNQILTNAFVYANSMLARTHGGLIAGVGIVLLLWSVMKLLLSIEGIFNLIWEVRQGRSWVRKVTDYLTIMLVSPILLIVSGSITVAIENQLGNLHLGFAVTFFGNLLAYVLMVGVFTFLYIVLPNTKIRFKPAVIAGIITTVFFELLSWAYIKFQIGASSLNAIYGGFAALPLFLIWLQYSWYVVLFGAELAYSSQHIDHYELEDDIKNLSVRYKKVISLMIAHLVATRFYNREKSLSVAEISQQLDLPSRLTSMIVNEFVTIGIFAEVRTDKEGEIVYQPGVTESKFTVKFLMDAIEQRGENNLPINDTQNLINNVNALMQEVDKSMDATLGHLLIKDIVKKA